MTIFNDDITSEYPVIFAVVTEGCVIDLTGVEQNAYEYENITGYLAEIFTAMKIAIHSNGCQIYMYNCIPRQKNAKTMATASTRCK